jgi:hypothetical protein
LLWHLFQNVVLLDEQRNGSAYHSLLKRSLTQADVRRQFDKLPIDALHQADGGKLISAIKVKGTISGYLLIPGAVPSHPDRLSVGWRLSAYVG